MIARRLKLSSFALLLLGLSACTVQPLYSNNANTGSVSANVAVESVDTRVEQQVRNRLIFLLDGGAAQPTDPEFTARIRVKSTTSSILRVSTPIGDSDTSASRVTLSGAVTIFSADDDKSGQTYVRSKTASFDRSTQQFANSRAEIDAQNRAAAELAEEFRVLILTATSNR